MSRLSACVDQDMVRIETVSILPRLAAFDTVIPAEAADWWPAWHLEHARVRFCCGINSAVTKS